MGAEAADSHLTYLEPGNIEHLPHFCNTAGGAQSSLDPASVQQIFARVSVESKYSTAYSDGRMKRPESTPLEVFLFKEMVAERMAAATQKVKTTTKVN